MPQCNKCGKKGLFLKIEEDSGLCLSCNEDFAKDGKQLTEKIFSAKKNASTAKEPEKIAQHAADIEKYGTELVNLHKRFQLEPSQELQDLIETYRKMKELAKNQSK